MCRIFQRFHQALETSPAAALALLCGAFRFLPLELYASHFQKALEAVMKLLEHSKQGELEKERRYSILNGFIYR